ncbi:DUF6879 family protein [Nonomuraea sp. NPDC005650]|uniref:DUF6879 family protein n=1 Tax=Nonomuraea sp. NPDC005650 TaxID=3157045 RepID=UPI0033A36D0A
MQLLAGSAKLRNVVDARRLKLGKGVLPSDKLEISLRRKELVMARRLRFNGSGSGEGGCPAVHEDLDTGEVIVHGPRLTDPDDIAQLQHLDEDEVAIVVPRNTLIDFGPRSRDTKPRILNPEQFALLFENFRHSAWHLEMRARYASDEATETYAQFVRGEAPAWDLTTPWSTTIRAKTEDGAAVGRQYNRLRDVARHYAVPYKEFAATMTAKE